MTRYRLWPLIVENGTCNVPDEILMGVWSQMVISGKHEKVFYGGTVFNYESWLRFVKDWKNLPVFVIDTKRTKVVFLAWLNSCEDTHAFGHFCPLGKFTREAVQMVLDFWKSFKNGQGEQLFDVIMGITPENNPEAVRFVKRIGFREVGAIPKLCKDVYQGIRCAGILTCMEL